MARCGRCPGRRLPRGGFAVETRARPCDAGAREARDAVQTPVVLLLGDDQSHPFEALALLTVVRNHLYADAATDGVEEPDAVVGSGDLQITPCQ
jgi:hypothetical protein